MKRSSISFALILTVLVLLPSGVKGGALETSPGPSQKPSKSANLGQGETQKKPAPVSKPDLSHAPNRTKTPTNEAHASDDAATTVIAISAIASAVAALLLAWFNWQLVGVTRDLHTAAEAALYVDRPFLIVTKVCRPTGNPLAAQVKLRNAGTAPADLVEVIGWSFLYEVPENTWLFAYAPAVQYPEQHRYYLNPPVIDAGAEIPDFIFVSLDDDEEEATEQRPLVRAVLGRIRYRGPSPQRIYETRFFWWQRGDHFFIGAPERNERT